MECPHCGFRNLAPVTRCARCQKPLPATAKPGEPHEPPKAGSEIPPPPSLAPVARTKKTATRPTAPPEPQPPVPSEYNPAQDRSVVKPAAGPDPAAAVPADEASDETTAFLDQLETEDTQRDPARQAEMAEARSVAAELPTFTPAPKPAPPAAAPAAKPAPPAAAPKALPRPAVPPPAPAPEEEQPIPIPDFHDAFRSDPLEGKLNDFFGGSDRGEATPDFSAIKIGKEDSEPEPEEPAAELSGADTLNPLLPFGERSGEASRSASGFRPVGSGLDLGLLGRRAAAGMVDLAVWVGLGGLLFRAAAALTGAGPLHGSALEWLTLVALPLLAMTGLLAAVYGALFLLLIGRTPGMALLGLRIAGAKVSPGSMILRALVLALELLPLGLGLLLCYRGAGLWLHDRASGTRIERGR